MDYLSRLRALRRENEIRTGVLRIVESASGIKFSPVDDPSMIFDDFEEARSFMTRSAGLTGSFTYQSGQPVVGGPAFIRQLATDYLSTGPDTRLELLQYRFDNAEQAQRMVRMYENQGFTGVPISDGHKTILMKAYRGGQQIDAREIFQFLERSQGIKISTTEDGQLSPKFIKRFRAFVTSKQYEGFVSPLTVSLYDAETAMDLSSLSATVRGDPVAERKLLSEAAERASDGIVRMSRGAFNELIRSYSLESKRLRDILNSGGPIDEATQTSILRSLEKIEEDIAELRRIGGQTRGGQQLIANIRLSGYNLDASMAEARYEQLVAQYGVDNAEVRKMRQRLDLIKERGAAGMIKGNVVLDENLGGKTVLLDYRNLTLETGRDIEAIAEEFAANRRSYMTLAMHKTDLTRADIQTLSSFPELFDNKILSAGAAETMQEFERILEGLKRGEVGPQYRTMLEMQAQARNPRVAERARNVLNFIDTPGLNIADDPNLLQKAIRNLVESYVDDSKGYSFLKANIPHSVRGEILPLHAVAGQDPRLRRLRPGQARFVDGLGWVIHDADAMRLGPAHGGFDFDDALNGMIRWSEGSEGLKLQGVFSRQPNARGEWSLLDISFDDDSVFGALGRSKDLESYKTITKDIRGLNSELKSLRSGPMTPATSRKIADREKRLKTKIRARDSILRKNFHALPENLPGRRTGGMVAMGSASDQLLERYRYAGDDDFLVHVRLAIEEGDKDLYRSRFLSQLDNEEFRKVLGELVDQIEGGNQGILGSYSNARMFVDHWYANNAKKFVDAGLGHMLRLEVFEQEKVIDAIKQSLTNRNVLEAIKTVESRMISQVVELAALGVHRGMDTRIDPSIMRIKGHNDAAIKAGLDRANDAISGRTYSINDLLMAQDDPRATIALLTGKAEELARQAEVFEESLRYPDAILSSSYAQEIRMSSEATADANKLLRENRKAYLQLRRLTEPGVIGRLSNNEFHQMVSDEMMKSLINLFNDVNDDKVAGRRAYRAVIRAMQIADERELPYQMFSSLHDTDFMREVIAHAKGIEGIAPSSAEELYRHMRSFTDEALSTPLNAILRDSDINLEFLDRLNRGAMFGRQFDAGRVSTEFREALNQIGFLLGPEEEFLGPARAATRISIPSIIPGKTDFTTLGGALYEYTTTRDMARSRQIRESIRQMFEGLAEVVPQFVTDEGISLEHRTWINRAVQELAPGTEQAARAQRVIDEAASVTEPLARRTGILNLGQDLSQNSLVRRGVMGAGAVLLAAGILKGVRRNVDQSEEDMNGPVELATEGGNYQRPPPQDVSLASGMPNRSMDGTTYVIRTRGGESASGLQAIVSSITGADYINTTTYDVPTQPAFRSEQERLRILNMYR